MAEGGELDEAVQAAIAREASDIHMTAGQAVWLRVDGQLQPLDMRPDDAWMRRALDLLLTAEQQTELGARRELDFSWERQGRRFRGNAYIQQGHTALALRLLPGRIPTLEDIGAPAAMRRLVQARQGLVLVTGRVGSGKTTSLAALLDAMNHTRSLHIITLEDPLEYIYEPDRCFISQRELGRDFLSFAQGLRSALREAPDVVLVGEIRNRDTMETAMMAAEAGILVFGTLHASSAAEAPLRVEGFFPLAERDIVRSGLADVLAGIYAQRLIPAAAGGRTAITEVLLPLPAVRGLLRQGKYTQLPSVMLSHQREGMRTFTVAADELYAQHRITSEVRQRCRAAAEAGTGGAGL